jgi:uncharacterized protein YkwD
VPRSFLRRPISLAAAALVAVAALVPVSATPVAAAGGAELVDVANGYRADAGKGPVSVHSVLNEIAVERGEQVADEGSLVHDFDYIMRRFDQENICWQGFGEILAYNGSGDYARFGEQWYNSSTHRSIMLGDYTHAGGHRAQADGRYYGVMIFVKLCGASVPPPTIAGFTDIAGSSFTEHIVWLVNEGITSGCTSTRYCPTDAVSRGEMATFVKRVLGLPIAAYDYFGDDGGSSHQDSINRMAEATLTAGCATGRYCPGGSLTRAQMASFLDRSLDLPTTNRDYFSDDDGTTHEAAINRLAAAGLVSGCTESRFCGRYAVSREQMAAFLHRAFGD